jgi:hypothetical protein
MAGFEKGRGPARATAAHLLELGAGPAMASDQESRERKTKKQKMEQQPGGSRTPRGEEKPAVGGSSARWREGMPSHGSPYAGEGASALRA